MSYCHCLTPFTWPGWSGMLWGVFNILVASRVPASEVKNSNHTPAQSRQQQQRRKGRASNGRKNKHCGAKRQTIWHRHCFLRAELVYVSRLNLTVFYSSKQYAKLDPVNKNIQETPGPNAFIKLTDVIKLFHQWQSLLNSVTVAPQATSGPLSQ